MIKIAATNDVDTDHTLTFKDSSNKPDPYKEQLNGEKQELKRQNSLHKEFRQMTINDRNDPAIHKTFLISYPLDYTTCSPFGRATQKMRGYDLDLEESRNRMVCIKDYWRPEEGEKKEEIYWSLEKKNIPNISRFYCGNDMCHKVRRNNNPEEGCRNQISEEENDIQVPQKQYETVSQPKALDWALAYPKTHSVTHYRMALDRVGRKLMVFRSTCELVISIVAAIEGSCVLSHVYFMCLYPQL